MNKDNENSKLVPLKKDAFPIDDPKPFKSLIIEEAIGEAIKKTAPILAPEFGDVANSIVNCFKELSKKKIEIEHEFDMVREKNNNNLKIIDKKMKAFKPDIARIRKSIERIEGKLNRFDPTELEGKGRESYDYLSAKIDMLFKQLTSLQDKIFQ